MIEHKSQRHSGHGLGHTKTGHSVHDYVVVEYGNSKEMEVQVYPEDIGTTDQYLIWTESQQARAKRNRRGRKLYKWRIDKLEIRRKTTKVPKRWSKMQ